MRAGRACGDKFLARGDELDDGMSLPNVLFLLSFPFCGFITVFCILSRNDVARTASSEAQLNFWLF